MIFARRYLEPAFEHLLPARGLFEPECRIARDPPWGDLVLIAWGQGPNLARLTIQESVLRTLCDRYVFDDAAFLASLSAPSSVIPPVVLDPIERDQLDRATTREDIEAPDLIPRLWARLCEAQLPVFATESGCDGRDGNSYYFSIRTRNRLSECWVSVHASLDEVCQTAEELLALVDEASGS